jgi:hypothetical protein
MKTMTLRGLQPELVDQLERAAKAAGKSINQTVLDALAVHFTTPDQRRPNRVHRDMDHLFGRWSAAEFEQVQGHIDAGRQVDDELWR